MVGFDSLENPLLDHKPRFLLVWALALAHMQVLDWGVTGSTQGRQPTSGLPGPWLKGFECRGTSLTLQDSEGAILMHVLVPAAADAGDAAQNPKTDEEDPLAGSQPWVLTCPSLRPA